MIIADVQLLYTIIPIIVLVVSIWLVITYGPAISDS